VGWDHNTIFDKDLMGWWKWEGFDQRHLNLYSIKNRYKPDLRIICVVRGREVGNIRIKPKMATRDIKKSGHNYF
jgi:hypothetical protein